VPTIAECRMRARERKALAEREPRHKCRHLNAAEAWLLLAARMEQSQRRKEVFPSVWDATLTDAADALSPAAKAEGRSAKYIRDTNIVSGRAYGRH
jgi:hypothetical protein